MDEIVMAWIARDSGGELYITNSKPVRDEKDLIWWTQPDDYDVQWIKLPSDADEKLISKHISWEDEPVEI